MLFRGKRKQTFAPLLAVFVNQRNSRFAQRNANGYRAILFRLSLDILYRITDNILVGHFEQIADAASDEAVKDENIPLYLDLFIGG